MADLTVVAIQKLQATAKAAEIRVLGKQGINYELKLEAEAVAIAAQSAQKAADNSTVNDLYDAWFPTTRRKDGGAELSRSYKRDVLPVLGEATSPARMTLATST